jgi:hypothetical protein
MHQCCSHSATPCPVQLCVIITNENITQRPEIRNPFQCTQNLPSFSTGKLISTHRHCIQNIFLWSVDQTQTVEPTWPTTTQLPTSTVVVVVVVVVRVVVVVAVVVYFGNKLLLMYRFYLASPRGRALKAAYCLGPLEHWDRGFETRWNTDVCPHFSVLWCHVQVETLRWADPPSKESHQKCLNGFRSPDYLIHETHNNISYLH